MASKIIKLKISHISYIGSHGSSSINETCSLKNEFVKSPPLSSFLPPFSSFPRIHAIHFLLLSLNLQMCTCPEAPVTNLAINRGLSCDICGVTDGPKCIRVEQVETV